MKNVEQMFAEISTTEAPDLHKALEELCAKAGVAKPLLCKPTNGLLLNSTLGTMFDYFAGAMHLDKPRVVLGDSARKIFGHASLSAPVSEELKAVLAHELSHLKHGDVRLHKILPLRLSPFIGLAAGMGGLALYNHIKKKEVDGNIADSDKKEFRQATLEQEIQKTEQENPWLSASIKIMKYVAAGTLGLIAGSFVSKALHNRMEFRADRFSAELMGSGQPLANALESFKVAAERLTPKKPNALAKYITWIMHPDIDKRISTLRSL
ncbi:MAG: M48 family metalloprotease [Alphaproteobacteria bacterium]|nr:M48 family metalloprotease [Alphaproteobacteria bacterium]